jgi:hypothetical protein
MELAVRVTVPYTPLLTAEDPALPVWSWTVGVRAVAVVGEGP